jgi:hypothetical protein
VRRIVIVEGRQSEDYSRSSIRGNQMNFGIPSAARFSDGLWSFFLKRRSHPMNLLRSGVERERLDPDTHDLLRFQLREHAIQYAVSGPTVIRI